MIGRRLRRELATGLALVGLAVAGAYWQAERTHAFDEQTETGAMLRLICPLHESASVHSLRDGARR